MERDLNEQNELIDRYLRGALSPEEQAEFEQALLYSDDLLDQLESERQLKQGLRDVAALAGDSPRSQNAPTGPMALFHSPRYAMAASFLLVVSLGVSSTLLYQREQQGQAHPGAATQIVPLVSVRSASGPATVNTLFADADEHIVLMLDPGFEPYTSFHATIHRLADGSREELVWDIDGLQPGYEDMLAVSIAPGVLRPGRYVATVLGRTEARSGEPETVRVDSIPFRVVPADQQVVPGTD